MKKHYKIIIPIVGILLVTLFIVILSLSNNNKISFFAIKKHYSIIAEDYPELEIIVYSNINDNEYFNSSKIDKSVLFNDLDFYSTSITNIELLQGKKLINGIEYYQYKIHLKFNFIIEKMFTIDKAKLEINYNTGEKIQFNVGNICFEKPINSNYLSIDKVQSICNDLGNLQSLVAVKISLSNNLENNIKINSIKAISSTIKVNNDYVIINEYNTEIDHTMHTTQLFGSNYNPYIESTNSFETIELTQNTAKDIIIPLTYTEKEFVDHMGFIIEMEYDGNVIYQIVNPYTLFSTSNINYVLYEYEVVKDSNN